VHAGREVSLKMTLEVSSKTGDQIIGGIDQPIIGQRKIENEIRLKDGEVNLIGGILEDQQTKALSGIPGLAQIPILKYLFSQTQTEHQSTEIVFVLVPHVIRQPEPARTAELLDVGTANAIELRKISSKPAAAQPSAPAVVPQGAPPQPNQAGNTGPRIMPAAGATGASFMFDPPSLSPAKGSTFTVNVMVTGGQNVYSVPVQLSYDPNQLQVLNVSNGGFLSQDGQTVALAFRDDPASGTLQITASRPPGAGAVSGQGAVVTLTMMAKSPGQSALVITRGGARDPSMQPIPMNGAEAAVSIQ